MKKIRYVSFLLIATFAVAAPRYTGVFGQIAGIDLVKTSNVFRGVEIWSGAAMGALEALVLEYIIQRTRRIAIFSTYWWASVVAAAIILITFPFVVSPYMMATMNGVLIRDVLNGSFRASGIFWIWTFLVSSLIPLITSAIGIVRDDGQGGGEEDTYYTNRGELDIPTPILASVFLKRWYNDHKREPLAPEMVRHFKHVTGLVIDIDQAEQFILDWRSEAGVTGRRPSTPTPGAVAIGRNGRQR